MISKHSAHSTSLPVSFRNWLWRYTCLLLLISMLWHRQAIFESKGDKLSSSAECRIRTQGLRHLFASRLNACYIHTYIHTYTHTHISILQHGCQLFVQALSTPSHHITFKYFGSVNFDLLSCNCIALALEYKHAIA